MFARNQHMKHVTNAAGIREVLRAHLLGLGVKTLKLQLS